jgi:hypothetical protein
MSGTEMYESGECERDVMIKTANGSGRKEKKNETKKTDRRGGKKKNWEKLK